MTMGMIGHLILRYVHITGGLMALGAGAGAMIYRKGSPMHRQHGTVFFVSMMAMASAGLYISLFITPIAANVMGGMMALYLTSTAWLTAWRAPGTTGRLEIAAATWGLATVVTAGTFAIRAARSADGMFGELPVVGYVVFGAIALLGTALDARMLARGGLTGAARTTRHLWRMSLAFFLATGSFFFGQAKLFTPEIRHSGLLAIPALTPLVLMLFWLVRIRVWPAVRSVLGSRPSVRAGPSASHGLPQ